MPICHVCFPTPSTLFGQNMKICLYLVQLILHKNNFCTYLFAYIVSLLYGTLLCSICHGVCHKRKNTALISLIMRMYIQNNQSNLNHNSHEIDLNNSCITIIAEVKTTTNTIVHNSKPLALNLVFFFFFFFVGQLHKDVPPEEHPGNLTIVLS